MSFSVKHPQTRLREPIKQFLSQYCINKEPIQASVVTAVPMGHRQANVVTAVPVGHRQANVVTAVPVGHRQANVNF